MNQGGFQCRGVWPSSIGPCGKINYLCKTYVPVSCKHFESYQRCVPQASGVQISNTIKKRDLDENSKVRYLPVHCFKERSNNNSSANGHPFPLAIAMLSGVCTLDLYSLHSVTLYTMYTVGWSVLSAPRL